MANIIELANTAYEERDRAQDQLATLLQKQEQEKAEYDKEMDSVQKMIEKQKTYNEHLKAKEEEKESLEQFAPVIEDEQPRALQAPKEKESQQAQMEKLEAFEEAFAKIEAATKMRDIDKLVNHFIGAEEINFKLFEFVNNMSNDIEALEKQIFDMRQEVKLL